MNLRIGVGYDLHRLSEDRLLILGGIQIPSMQGLHGHSDADVVIHAVIDSLLGAAGLPDIGEQFPDTDPAYHNADSRVLLLSAMKVVRDAGYEPVNIDLIIHAEVPKLSPYKRAIAASLAGLCDIPLSTVNVKAKTNEGVGAVGHQQAIACTAAALLQYTR